ncbi:hypothetical protein MPER_10686 [Moniliophthora perniciosa FA553]|nr:hypothetical protein MPER_10686 [Moniliophthora perniciosa FA553]
MALQCPPFRPLNPVNQLLILRNRNDEAQLSSREIGVMFEDLRVVGTGSASSYLPTFGSLFNPLDVLEKIQTMRHPPVKPFLKELRCSEPGEMLRA